MEPLRVGVIGIGNISGIYLKNLTAYRSTEVVAVADLERSRAESAAGEYGVRRVLSPEELLASPDVELVLNLTVPKAHGPVALQAVRAGKHVYNEKPLSVDTKEAGTLISEAKQRGILVGCAPDTFLGAGLQTCRDVLDRGEIGQPVGVVGAMRSRGPEPWHPAPEFFYKRGGGPMLDMGPYYITAMVSLLGGVRRLAGISRVSFPERPVPLSNANYYRSGAPDSPDAIQVETPTHIAGVMEFTSGPVGELVTSFDVYGDWPSHPITLFGSEGTMKVPDPNTFGGEVLVKRKGEDEWRSVPLTHGFAENSRGLGVLDMAYAIRTGSRHRASGDLAFHVLDVMTSFERSSEEGRHITFEHPAERPQPLAPNQYENELPAGVA